MPITLGELKKFVLHTLQKNPGYNGFYTDEKCQIAIQECLDFVATRMMTYGGGLMKRLAYIDTNTTDSTYPLPADAAIIDAVRYLSTDVYLPLDYESDTSGSMGDSTSTTDMPSGFRLVGDQIYFNPKPTTVGSRYLQVEYLSYPTWLMNDDQKVDGEFDRSMLWYVKYRSATILVVNNGGFPRWSNLEAEWKESVDAVIQQRVRKVRYVKEFME